jgi:hypothetical protein
MDDDYKAASTTSGGEFRRRVKRHVTRKRKGKPARKATRRLKKKFA